MSTELAVREGFIPFHGYRTWYRVVGDHATPDQLPLLLVHGGPGIPSDCLEPLAALAGTGRPVVFYDQLGCGKSDRPDDATLWGFDLFLDELAAVRQALGLDGVHLLGFSFGGALALEYALTKPAGLASLVLHSTFASSQAAVAREQRAYDQLPVDVAATLRRHEEAGTIDDPTYRAARQVFDLRFVCRIDRWPDFLQRAIANANFAIGAVMEDRDDRHAPGGYKNWDVTAHLGEIDVPTLVVGGRHDGLAGGQEAVLAATIPDAEVVVFEESSHYAHAEEPERFLAVLDDFLARVERELTPSA
jgi:proline-specific peptidase